MNLNNIVIVGLGEVGSGLYDVYLKSKKYNLYRIDNSLNIYEKPESCDILNICIPYSDDFINIVNSYINTMLPKITVIHSTVSPGTTKKLGKNVCHSPIRGVHPNIGDGILTFLKYIGSEDIEISKAYESHLKDLNIKSYICKDSLTSEYAKLLDTTYYGLCIAWHSEVMSFAKDMGLDFEEIMTIYNKSYNDGYATLGKTNVIRPVLYPTNKIGGHCIIPNARILKESFSAPLIDEILKYE